MKTFFQLFVAALLAIGTTACFNTELISGDVKAESTEGDFNSLISAGVLQKLNDVQTKTLVITGTNGSKVVTLTLSEVAADTTTNCLTPGTYEASNITNNAQLIYATSSLAYTSIISCSATISDCVEDDKSISGTFEGTVATTTGDTISFSNGSFDKVVFSVQ
ncbi:MAG: DUF6252 family protein [Bacteroidia bacterium]|nr:DUF6252 family protein [Bacteroidia bacterium]